MLRSKVIDTLALSSWTTSLRIKMTQMFVFKLLIQEKSISNMGTETPKNAALEASGAFVPESAVHSSVWVTPLMSCMFHSSKTSVLSRSLRLFLQLFLWITFKTEF